MHSNLFVQRMIALDCSLDYSLHNIWGGLSSFIFGELNLYVWITDCSIGCLQRLTSSLRHKKIKKKIHVAISSHVFWGSGLFFIPAAPAERYSWKPFRRQLHISKLQRPPSTHPETNTYRHTFSTIIRIIFSCLYDDLIISYKQNYFCIQL